MTWIRSLVTRLAALVGIGETNIEPAAFEAGPDHRMSSSSRPTYDYEVALQAFAAFPTTFAATSRRAEDLSQIEIYVSQDRDGKQRIDTHPLLDLLERPNSAQTGVEFLRQLYVDFAQTRFAIAIVLTDGRGEPVSLVRLHPNRVEPVPGAHGLPVAYRNVQTGAVYSLDSLVVIRGPSWEDNPDGLNPTTPIQALDSTLRGEKEVRDFVGRAAKVGRPSAVISPGEAEETWTQEQADQIADEYGQRVKAGGALVNRTKADVKIVQTTPADLEAQTLRASNREDIMAVQRIGPVLLGYQGQNYAEAEMQLLVYWLSQISDAAMFSAVFSQLARRFNVGGRVYVKYDFSTVPVLQRARNSQLERIEKLVKMGASPKEAAQFEGLPDAPLPDEAPQSFFGPAQPAQGGRDVVDAPSTEPAPKDDRDTREDIDDDPGVDRALDNVVDFDDWLAAEDRVERASSRGPFDPYVVRVAATTEERAQLWSEWIRTTQEPFERKIEARIARFLLEQRERIVEAAGERVRAPGDWYDFEAEIERLAAEIEDIFEAALDAGFTREQLLLKAPDLAFSTLGEVVARLVSDVASSVTTHTAKIVQGLVDEHLREGTSVLELQAAIEASTVFGQRRAQRVARTESAHTINVGQRAAQEDAWNKGYDFEVVWLTARDTVVRDSHLIDGQAIQAGEQFTSAAGNTAPGPSQFGIASEDIECRCTTYSRRKASSAAS